MHESCCGNFNGYTICAAYVFLIVQLEILDGNSSELLLMLLHYFCRATHVASASRRDTTERRAT
jgi:hypothetical protein